MIMQTYLPLLAGSAFALAGFLLLTVQLAAYDSALAYRRLTKEIDAQFGHDTCIYPDHKP
jgi:hypothetical protein